MIYKKSRILQLFLVLGYAFLYIPLLCIVAYSFNESSLVTVWSGFSLKWYTELFSNETILRATWTSFRIASISATISVILGTMSAISIVRFRRFRGKALFTSLTAAPLVMPDVVMGLSMLLLFIGIESLIGWPKQRGMTTVTIAHITLSISYVTAVVQSRLSEVDQSLEEAALNLGATPVKVFFLITLPLIYSSIMTGWLFAFALSLDDVVIASFVSGPGATTLPMVIFSSLRFGVSPQINALTTIIMFLLSIGVIIAAILMYKKSVISKRERSAWQNNML